MLSFRTPALARLPSLYLGPVATRQGYIGKDIIGTVGRYHNFGSVHRAMDDITSLQIAYAAYRVEGSGFTETAVSANVTIRLAIEYPFGTFTPVTYSGAAAGTIIAGQDLYCDEKPIAIPRGRWFRLIGQMSSTVNLPFNANMPAMPGDLFAGSASALSDPTSGGVSIGDASAGTNSVMPAAILGRTRRPTVGIIGTSREVGQADSSDDAADLGETARTIGERFAYLNAGISGDTAQAFVASHTRRVALLQNCSHIVISTGVNDFAAGRTASQMLGDVATIAGYFPDKKVWVCTITPKTTGTFADLAGQTVTANEALRTGFNDALRAWTNTSLRDKLYGVIDLCDAVESGINSGKWKPNFTGDGTHGNTDAMKAIQMARVVPIDDFVRAA